MYPPISANSRIALNDDRIVLDDRPFHIHAGDHIGWSVFQMQRRKDIFGPNADVWNPDRWSGPNALNASSPNFQAWGYGPRIVRYWPSAGRKVAKR